jgi:hypothetical protein
MSSDTVSLTAGVNKLFYLYYVPYRGVVGGRFASAAATLGNRVHEALKRILQMQKFCFCTRQFLLQ